MKKSNTMAGTLRNNRGFTLIEMAIVLVIIGVIIGAVVKGQDLVENAKAKQFASKVKAWEISLNTYADRKGALPGDSGRNGVIGDTAELSAFADLSTAKLSSPPEKTFLIGGSNFVVSVGHGGSKNYLVVCKDLTCSSAYNPGDSADAAALKFFESYDTSIDGSSDAKVGIVTGATAVTTNNYKTTAVTVGAGNADWMQATDIVALVYQVK
ncbi:MAG TPA: prepilin-type N-terminal cleavage/methylation domain-containing protein [Dongiaceae bacterium]|nr:prepilin-type N-terminal cleavage/methylation domain-containing protein [Dongiaceae bacterium]